MSRLLQQHYQHRKLEDWVENRTAYTLQHAELSIFETQQKAEKVFLQFDDPVIASMISGKKVMYLKDRAAFDFFPGQSVVVPAGKPMLIDFPEAKPEDPTECLALTIAPEKISENITFFQEQTAIEKEAMDWSLDIQSLHIVDNHDVASEDLPTLLGMLRARLQPRLDGHEMKLHWSVTPLPRLDDFGPEKALQLMRILQEVFVNILKHSKAKNIYLDTRVIEASQNTGQIEINIRDDGSWTESTDKTGRGLRNMQRRAESIAANLKIDGQPDGTRVQIVLSYDSNS